MGLSNWYNSLTVLYVLRDMKNIINKIIPITIRHTDFKILCLRMFWMMYGLSIFSDCITTLGDVVLVKTDTFASESLDVLFSMTTSETFPFLEFFLEVSVFVFFLGFQVVLVVVIDDFVSKIFSQNILNN